MFSVQSGHQDIDLNHKMNYNLIVVFWQVQLKQRQRILAEYSMGTNMSVTKTGAARMLTLMVFTVLLALASGCGGDSSAGKAPTAATQIGARVETAGGAYTDLKPSELKPMLDNKDFFLVDTHIPPEGRLPKTDARIPFDQVEQQIAKFPTDKSAKIVLACRSGRMSSEASATLVKLGYTNVYNLEGGMIAWQAAGYEIIPEGK